MDIIGAILTLIKQNNFKLTADDSENDAKHQDFKNYVKNLFGNSFSYIGNPANTPDLMLREGDAIEIASVRCQLEGEKFFQCDDKKITETDSPVGDVLLNNVPPMQFLDKFNPLISKKCRESGDWGRNRQRDIIYVVGVLEENRLRCLSMVYGRDYCAKNDYYSDVRRYIRGRLNDEKISLAMHTNSEKSHELARINRFDPLGLTSARLYTHWRIKNPWRAFNYLYRRPKGTEFDFMCVINADKLHSFGNFGTLWFLSEYLPNLRIIEVKIRNPDNPKTLRDAVLVTYEI